MKIYHCPNVQNISFDHAIIPIECIQQHQKSSLETLRIAHGQPNYFKNLCDKTITVLKNIYDWIVGLIKSICCYKKVNSSDDTNIDFSKSSPVKTKEPTITQAPKETLWPLIQEQPVFSWYQEDASEMINALEEHAEEISSNHMYQGKVVEYLSSNEFANKFVEEPQEQIDSLLRKINLYTYKDASKDIFDLTLQSPRRDLFYSLLKNAPYELFPKHPMLLFMACARGDINLVKSLIIQNKGEYLIRLPLNISLFYVSCTFAEFEIVKFLHEECKFEIEETTTFGVTPLKTLILGDCDSHGYAKVIAYLIQHHANVHHKDKKGNTVLHGAAARNRDDTEIIKMLISAGVEIDCTNECLSTPLSFASENGHLETIKCLIEHGANIHHENQNGFTALHRAAQKGKYEAVKVLIVAGAKINCTTKRLSTPLSLASENGHLSIVFELLKHGADPLTEDFNKKTPIDYLKNDDLQTLAQLIIQEAVQFEDQILQLKKTLSYLNTDDAVPSSEILEEDRKLILHFQKGLSTRRAVLDEYKGDLDIKSTQKLFKNCQTILSKLLASILQLQSSQKYQKMEKKLSIATLPDINIEKAVIFLGLLSPSDYENLQVHNITSRNGLIACGLLNEKDLQTIGIDEQHLEKLNTLLDKLNISLKDQAQSQEGDALKQRSLLLNSLSNLKENLQESESLCTTVIAEMDQLFHLEEFVDTWKTEQMQPIQNKLNELKTQIESLSLGSLSYKETLFDLYAKQEALLKLILVAERKRLFLMLQRYLKQTNLLSVFESLKQEGIRSLSDLKNKKTISDVKYFYDLERNTPRRLID